MATKPTMRCEGAALTGMSFPILIRSGQGGCRLEPRAGAQRRLRGDKAAAVVLNETLWKATDPDCLNYLRHTTMILPPTPRFRMKRGKENLQYLPATEGGLPGTVAGNSRYLQRLLSGLRQRFRRHRALNVSRQRIWPPTPTDDFASREYGLHSRPESSRTAPMAL